MQNFPLLGAFSVMEPPLFTAALRSLFFYLIPGSRYISIIHHIFPLPCLIHDKPAAATECPRQLHFSNRRERFAVYVKT